MLDMAHAKLAVTGNVHDTLADGVTGDHGSATPRASTCSRKSPGQPLAALAKYTVALL